MSNERPDTNARFIGKLFSLLADTKSPRAEELRKLRDEAFAARDAPEEELATTKRGVTVKPSAPDIVAEALAEIEANARATVAAQQEKEVEPMDNANNIDALTTASDERLDIERALDASPVELPRSIYSTASARVRYALWLLGERTRELEHTKATYANRVQRAKEAERLVQTVSDAVVDALKAARLEGRADFIISATTKDDEGKYDEFDDPIPPSLRNPEEEPVQDKAWDLYKSSGTKRYYAEARIRRALGLLVGLVTGEEFAMKDAER